MAKQNVSFAERHLEKVVIGVAGAVLAAVTFLYVVQDPYTIEESGEVLSPSAFYGRLDEKVGEVVNRFKSPQPLSPPEWKAPPSVGKTSTNLPVVFVPPNPAVPKRETGIELGGKLEVVRVLPPGKPALTANRGMGALSSPQVKVIGETQPPTAMQDKGEIKDHYWAAVFATVRRRDQQEAYFRAQYAVDRQQLVVTKVEVERQRLLPSGEWEEPARKVMPFATVVLSCPPTVPLARENGETSIDPVDYDRIQKLTSEAYTSQSAILRPDFQNLLEADFKVEWKTPVELPDGVKFNWVEDYKIVTSEGPLSTDVTAAGARPGAAAPRISPAEAAKEINKLVDKGRAAETKRDGVTAKASYTEADQKITALLGTEAAGSRVVLPEKEKTRLAELQKNLQAKLLILSASESKAREGQAAAAAATLGPDVDLCWSTDTTVKPGEAYRYRVRLQAVNPYAGLLRRLKNPEDAAKVILAGEWSDWSDAILVPPSKHLFFTGIDAATQNIKAELFHWTNGEWKSGRQTLAIGQPVSWTQSLAEYTYDGIIVALDPARSYEDRSVNRRKVVSYKDARPTAAVTMVNYAGDVEEHLILADVSRKRELSDELLPKRPRDTTIRSGAPSPREIERQPSGRTPGTPRRPGEE